eukprot:44347_1
MGACLQTDEYCELGSVESCTALKSLKQLLQSDILYSRINSKDLDIVQVLNDYLHVMEHHVDDDHFEQAVQSFSMCDMHKCDALRRNHRVSGNDQQTKDEYEASIRDILDKIHCYFCHWYDVGNRLTPQEIRTITDDDIENKDTDPFNEQLMNKRVKAMNVLLREKRKHCEKIYDELNINKRNTNKFNQLIESKLSNKNNTNANVYSFGYPFEYDEYDIKNDAAELNIEKRYIAAKYTDLKEEITTNDIATLTIQQYQNEYRKAEIHFKTLHNRTKFRDIGIYRETESDNYMSLECILSLMIYCNYDVLQYEFSKTYREENGANHSNFYFLAKYMKHAFSKYHASSDYTNVGTFYHGISEKLVFPAYVDVQIHSPLSTSSSLEVAINFTDNNEGLVISFGLINGGALGLSWLSNYPNEHEYLFIQDEWSVSIADVIDPTLGYQYGMLLQSLNFIHELVSVEGDVRYRKIEPAVSSLIISIIKHQLSLVPYTASEYPPIESMSVYGQEICNVFFRNQTEICIQKRALLDQNPSFNSILNLLFHVNSDCVDLRVIFALFPNLKEVTVDIDLKPEILDAILVYLKTRRELNIHTSNVVNINAKRQDVMALADRYGDSFRQNGGYLFYDLDDPDRSPNSYFPSLAVLDCIYLHMYDEAEFVFNWIVMNLQGKRPYCNLGANNTLAKLMGKYLIKMQLISKPIVDDAMVNEAQWKLFSDCCAARTTIHMDWKDLSSSSKRYFFEIFCDAKMEWIKMEIVNQLFPNLEVVNVTRMNLSQLVLENIMNHLKKRDTKFKCIVLGAHKYDSEISTAHAVKYFQKQFNDVGFEMYDEAMCRDGGGETDDSIVYEYSEDEPKVNELYIKRQKQ